MSLDQAVEWINNERPLLWTGSIFSVPAPSNFPSGAAITESLLEMVLPDTVAGKFRDQLIAALLPRWPLELLLDELEYLQYDLSESMLQFFKRHDETAAPNDLHRAIVSYYQKGYSRAPLCFTVNWDTLQERAFGEAGFRVNSKGPGWKHSYKLEKQYDDHTIFVHHPHGSFQRKDIVCSLRREARTPAQSLDWLSHPILFLGYSGYEPSLYPYLEDSAYGHLWCIRSLDDLRVPAKRRLLCHPKTHVYVGDLRDLLHALGVLDNKNLRLESKAVRFSAGVPSAVKQVLSMAMVAHLDPGLCLERLSSTHLSYIHRAEEPEAVFRYIYLMRALVHHIRDRVIDPWILSVLTSTARFRDSEQVWVTLLAYMLRSDPDVPGPVAEGILARGEALRPPSAEARYYDDMLYPGVLGEIGKAELQRSGMYRHYVATNESIDEYVSNPERYTFLYWQLPLIGGDMGLLGEYTELLAFELLRQGKLDLARNCFDYAASCWYLTGHWNGGRLAEWASNNIEAVKNYAESRNTLVIPHPDVLQNPQG
ncbi:MAG: hypothetical protein HYU86_11665 [Chloroflexi bacterium]|nr:hypothetical protein [Chloroflexota bacterium]